MRIQKLETTDAFVVWDLDGAARSVGIARLAPKILQEGAEMLARSVTYSFAEVFMLQIVLFAPTAPNVVWSLA